MPPTPRSAPAVATAPEAAGPSPFTDPIGAQIHAFAGLLGILSDNLRRWSERTGDDDPMRLLAARTALSCLDVAEVMGERARGDLAQWLAAVGAGSAAGGQRSRVSRVVCTGHLSLNQTSSSTPWPEK